MTNDSAVYLDCSFLIKVFIRECLDILLNKYTSNVSRYVHICVIYVDKSSLSLV